MPTIPRTVEMSAKGQDILNAIRNSATANYKGYVPEATGTVENLRSIGDIIMDYSAVQNEFLNALVNRIGLVLITSKMFANPWAMFKRGVLEYGETIEEVFTNIAKPFTFNVDEAEKKVFARNKPDVRSAFHSLNYRKFYKITIQEEQLRQAFLSWTGLSDLIATIVDSMYNGAAYDEFVTMKYMVAKALLNGRLYPITIDSVSSANMKSITSTIKGVSNDYTFPKTEYNPAGVVTHSQKDEQYLIVNSKFDATMDVEVLASAFNMTKAEFTGHRVLVDSFGSLDTERLNMLFATDVNYKPLTQAEITALDSIPCILVDRDWFMIFDNMYKMTEIYNGEGLYWNYWYHTWKTFSTSPFANASVFISGTPTVESITITPTAVAVGKGQTVNLSADVTTTNFAPKTVAWSIPEGTEGISVDIYGNVTVNSEAEAGQYTVTATSTFDNSVSTTVTITVV